MNIFLKLFSLFSFLLFSLIVSAQNIKETDTFEKEGLVYNSSTNKLVSGIVISYYPNSNILMSSKHYKNGELSGKTVFYYLNKSHLLKGKYKNNHKQGVWKTWSENKLLICKETYKNNMLNGKVMYRNSKGLKIAEGTYKDDIRIGWWTEWDDDGKIVLQTRKHDSIH